MAPTNDNPNNLELLGPGVNNHVGETSRPTIRVRERSSGVEMIINAGDFDESIHERLIRAQEKTTGAEVLVPKSELDPKLHQQIDR